MPTARASACVAHGGSEMTDRAYMDQAIGAEEAGALFGLAAPTFLRYRACLPSFPKPVNRRTSADDLADRI